MKIPVRLAKPPRALGSRLTATLLALIISGCSPFQARDFRSLSSKVGFDLSNNQNKVCSTAPIVGKSTLQRLNRVEYNNTLRDLLGIQTRPADAFPTDTMGEWFTNNADALSLDTPLLDKYFSAAEAAINEAFTLNRSRFMICSAQTTVCAAQILKAFADKAYRRSATDTEVNNLVKFISVAQSQNESFEVGIKLAMRAALVSSDFLYREIIHPAPNDPNSTIELSGYELASRLSYFLWSSMPDEALLAAARDNSIQRPEVLRAQVKRMLADPKASSFVDNFGIQSFGLQFLGNNPPDGGMFPQYNSQLREAMLTETKMLLQEIITRDLNPDTLVKADYSFVNESLASLYGMTGVRGASFTKVSLSGANRQGVLGHAGILTLTSHSTDPSIVLRGKFVIKNLLCDPPSAPPTVIKNDPTISDANQSKSRLNNPACMSCHLGMDPIGYALQGFNVLGIPRTTDEKGAPLDLTGKFTDGTTFSGAIELSNTVAKDPRYNLCIAKKLLSYSLGRDLNKLDNCAVSQIAAEATPGKTFSDLIVGLVTNDSFRKQSGGTK